MSEKPTTPGPPVGVRRHKRPAPTIDLTATETASNATAPPEPPPAHEQPEAAASGLDAQSTANQGSSFKPPGRFSLPAVMGGFFGAALTAIILAALWFAGAVPARYVASGDGGAQIADLEKRMRELESRPADPGVSERLTAAENAMKSLGVTLTALTKRSDEGVSIAADARSRADAAQNAVTKLRDNVQNLNTSAGLSSADADAVQRRLSALEQATAKPTSDKGARLALSAAALRDAVASGMPFVAELDEVRSLGADEKSLAPLIPFATSGVVTVAALAQELRSLVPAIMKASGAQALPGGYLERLEASAAKLVRIRPVNAPEGDDSSAVLARVEKEAASAAIDDALVDLGKLDPAIRAPAQNWIAKAQSRQAALAAARQLASTTAHVLGKQ